MRSLPKQFFARASAGVLALVFVGVLAAYQFWPAPDPFLGDEITDPAFPSLTYGIQASLMWNPDPQYHLQLVELVAFSHIKQIFAWEDIQPGPDLWSWEEADAVVDMVEERGIRLVARLTDAPDWTHPDIEGEKDVDFVDAPPDDPADYGVFCGAFAARYAGRIDAYQVWNETNLARERCNQTPNAEEYVALLAACSDAIRAADPDAVIISAGLAPTGNNDATAKRDDMYLQDMYTVGFQQYVDAVGAHAAGYNPPTYGPDDAAAENVGRWFSFRRIEDLRKVMIHNGDAQRQMAILEFGWTRNPGVHPDYAWYAVDERTQAEYMIEAYTYAAENWRPWVGLMSAIYISDPYWTWEDEEYWFSLVMPDGITTTAFKWVANMPKYCDDHVIPARDPGSPEARGLARTQPCP